MANIASSQTVPYRNRTACHRFASHTQACHTPEHEKQGKVLHKGTHSCIFYARIRWKDKCVLLLDVLTTGTSFIQLRRRLIGHGAKFVIGLFLAKTIAFEDE